MNISERPGKKLSGSIHLYTLVISDGFQVPVWSLLSERHDANFLTFWLREFVRVGGNVPKVFTSDMSLALLNAAAIGFANYSNIEEYVNDLFGFHIGEWHEKKIAPDCFIRIDIAHFIKNIASCNALHNVRRKVKELFTRSVAEIVLETNFNNIQIIMKAILIVAGCQTRGM